MLSDTNWTHARSTAAVGDSKRFVKVQVADVSADVTRRCDAHHCVHVGSVNVDLATAPVHDVRGFDDGFVEYAVSGWLRDHSAGNVALGNLSLQVLDIDFTVGQSLYFLDLEAAHRGSGEISAMGRRRDQADVAVTLSVDFLLLPDGHQACEFAL